LTSGKSQPRSRGLRKDYIGRRGGGGRHSENYIKKRKEAKSSFNSGLNLFQLGRGNFTNVELFGGLRGSIKYKESGRISSAPYFNQTAFHRQRMSFSHLPATINKQKIIVGY